MSPHLHLSSHGADGPTVVLLHGFGGAAEVWHSIAEKLSWTCRVLIYDLPGHARSLHFPDAGPVKVAVRAIADDLQERALGPVHLAGHSMGGAIATLIAASRPDLVASLTLIAPGGMGEEINGPLLQRYAAARSSAEIEACLADMSGPAAKVATYPSDALAKQRDAAGQTEKLTEIVQVITRGGRQGQIPKQLLEGLQMPVNVIWGDQDPVLPFGQAHNLPPSFKVTVIPGAGHMLIEEAPDVVLDVLAAAIESGKSQ